MVITFLDTVSKVQPMAERINRLNFIKIKKSSALYKTVSRERRLGEITIILQNTHLIKSMIQIHKEFLKFNSKKMNNLITNI